MGLSRFFKNYFTVQTNQYAGQDSDGAVFRDSGYTNVVDFVNVRCSIQGINTFDISNVIGKIDEEVTNVIYHNIKTLLVNTNYRFLTHLDPFQKITNFSNPVNIRIFTFRGQRNAVFHKDRGKPFELFVEENKRETL